VQEASLALVRAIEQDPQRFESPVHARNYFLRTVRNIASRSHRASQRELPLEAEPPAHDDPAVREALERQERLARLLRELDPAQRDLIAQRYLERRTLADIARETGVPISTLHGREQALLAFLRKRLDASEQEAAG